MNHLWDANDSRILVCQCEKLGEDSKIEQDIVSFYASDAELGVYDTYSAPPNVNDLFDVNVPHHRYIVEVSQALYR